VDISCFRNRPGPAIEAFHSAMRLSPLDPLGWIITGGLAFAYLAAGQYEQSIEWAKRCLLEQPRHCALLRAKAVSYAHLGNITEARAALAELLKLQPGLTIATLSLPSLTPELAAVHVEGLRKAGMPEE
jgi:predicted Zn-dependent protease